MQQFRRMVNEKGILYEANIKNPRTFQERPLEKEWTKTSEPKLTFNVPYCSGFQNMRNILQELHLLLAPDKDYKKVFSNVPVAWFCNDKSLKDYPVRAALPKTNETERCKPCRKKTCLACLV